MYGGEEGGTGGTFQRHGIGNEESSDSELIETPRPPSLRFRPYADLLLPPCTLKLPTSVFYFVCSTGDKKDDKVNNRTQTREKYTGNKERGSDVGLTLGLSSAVLHKMVVFVPPRSMTVRPRPSSCLRMQTFLWNGGDDECAIREGRRRRQRTHFRTQGGDSIPLKNCYKISLNNGLKVPFSTGV